MVGVMGVMGVMGVTGVMETAMETAIEAMLTAIEAIRGFMFAMSVILARGVTFVLQF